MEKESLYKLRRSVGSSIGVHPKDLKQNVANQPMILSHVSHVSAYDFIMFHMSHKPMSLNVGEAMKCTL